jgi:hypothetical protein
MHLYEEYTEISCVPSCISVIRSPSLLMTPAVVRARDISTSALLLVQPFLVSMNREHERTTSNSDFFASRSAHTSESPISYFAKFSHAHRVLTPLVLASVGIRVGSMGCCFLQCTLSLVKLVLLLDARCEQLVKFHTPLCLCSIRLSLFK